MYEKLISIITDSFLIKEEIKPSLIRSIINNSINEDEAQIIAIAIGFHKVIEYSETYEEIVRTLPNCSETERKTLLSLSEEDTQKNHEKVSQIIELFSDKLQELEEFEAEQKARQQKNQEAIKELEETKHMIEFLETNLV